MVYYNDLNRGLTFKLFKKSARNFCVKSLSWIFHMNRQIHIMQPLAYQIPNPNNPIF
jgi:hypothetical protein